MKGESHESAEIDTDRLHNAIDLSMSHALDIVASWMQPAKALSKLEETKRIAEDKQFEDFGRRPGRLGIGAVIPKESPSSRQNVELVKKLTGKRKKRDDTDTFSGVPDPSRLGATSNSASDDEESRSRAISKKPKVTSNPFEMKKKKKLKMDQNIKLPMPPVTHSPPTPEAPAKTPHPFKLPPQQVSKSVIRDSSSEDTVIAMSANSSVIDDGPNIGTSSKASVSSGRTSSPFAPRSSPSKRDIPLLNLTPIPDAVDLDISPNGAEKKKKRRKKKKKKTLSLDDTSHTSPNLTPVNNPEV